MRGQVAAAPGKPFKRSSRRESDPFLKEIARKFEMSHVRRNQTEIFPAGKDNASVLGDI
jgi:hypothetical protein